MLAGLDQLAEVAALVCHPPQPPVAPIPPRFPTMGGPPPAAIGEAGAAMDGAQAMQAMAGDGSAIAGLAEDGTDPNNIGGADGMAQKLGGMADKYAAAMKGVNAAKKTDAGKLRVG